MSVDDDSDVFPNTLPGAASTCDDVLSRLKQYPTCVTVSRSLINVCFLVHLIGSHEIWRDFVISDLVEEPCLPVPGDIYSPREYYVMIYVLRVSIT